MTATTGREPDPTNQSALLRLAVPKGRMHGNVVELLADAGIRLHATNRNYRPQPSLEGLEVKVLKPQNIVEMLHVGSRDIGFAGADWVAELDGELVELLDTGQDPVRVVAAAPTELLEDGRLPRRAPSERPLLVASEYERLTTDWIRNEGLHAKFVRSYGATEVFPPEDADCIVDNTATGSTLRANGLEIVGELMRSSTRLYANPQALEVPEKREIIDRFVLLLNSVLDARKRVMVEVNVTKEDLERVIEVLPCMREPTVSTLHGGAGFAVKAAVLRADLAQVVPEIKARGGTDIVVTKLAQIVG